MDNFIKANNHNITMNKNTESYIKAYILTNGVDFSKSAIDHAISIGAKGQNMVYNCPVNIDGGKYKPIRDFRPQELFVYGLDGFRVCVSCVSPVPGRMHAYVDFKDGKLIISTSGYKELALGISKIEFVLTPEYYSKKLSSGRNIKRVVSSCGYNELNLWLWHDCSVEGKCSFCGINTVKKLNNNQDDLMYALEMTNIKDSYSYWIQNKEEIIVEVCEAIEIAKDDPCFMDRLHFIMITGNLKNSLLNLQSDIYADVASTVSKKFGKLFYEGIVAVTAPPSDLGKLEMMKSHGIDIVVFNLEAYTPESFDIHCKGKTKIGREHFLKALIKGVDVFGHGKSWSNFVLGLETPDELLEGCRILASKGINPSANVLHIDYGSSLEIEPPTYEEVVYFFKELDVILKTNNLEPYYTEEALRTSLSNEAYHNRFCYETI